MKILICDDDVMIRKAIEFKMSRENYTLDFASDGKLATDMIREEAYGLIVTDLLMPYVGGLEMINLVRNELKRNTPIIVLSRLGDEETIMEAFNLGADDYLTKPFSPSELLIRMKKILLNTR